MGKGPTDHKVIRGRALPHAEFKLAVLAAAKTALEECPVGVSVRQIVTALDPAITDAQLKRHVANEVQQLVKRDLLHRGERGVLSAGPNLHTTTLGEVVGTKAELSQRIFEFAVSQGGWFKRSELLEELDRGATEAYAGASTAQRVMSEMTTLRRVWTGFYSLSGVERRARVLEGRWVRTEMHAMLAKRWLDPDEGLAEDMLGGLTDVQNGALNMMETTHFESVGTQVNNLLRALGEAQMTKALHQDSALVGALEFSLLGLTGRAGLLLEGYEKQHPDQTSEERHADLLDRFLEGYTFPHCALRTPFYEALGALLEVEPVELSRGVLSRTAAEENLANTAKTVSGRVRAQANTNVNLVRKGELDGGRMTRKGYVSRRDETPC